MLAGQGIVDLEKTGHKLQGKVVVHGLWKQDKTCILEIVVTDTNSKTYKHMSLWCLELFKTCTLLSYSVDVMAGKEIWVFEKLTAAFLAEK
jgi:hypothetical protein